jgi:hypothetical protein
MRRILVLCLLLSLSGPAHAEPRRTAACIAAGIVLVAAAVGLAATGIWARATEQNAPTLMDFKRLDSLRENIGVGSLPLFIAATPLFVVGGYSAADDRKHTALSVGARF